MTADIEHLRARRADELRRLIAALRGHALLVFANTVVARGTPWSERPIAA